MQAISYSCTDFGHEVRHTAPFQVHTGSKYDLAIVWNGIHPKYREPLKKLRSMEVPILVIELGWYPQRETFQVDPEGFNLNASWARVSLQPTPGLQVTFPDHDEILVILQLDDDTQIKQFSPHFPNMASFVKHLIDECPHPLRIRQHPHHKTRGDVRSVVKSNPSRCRWDKSQSLGEALMNCKAVATVNSSSAIEALIKNIPVFCFGESIYRHEGAVVCCTNKGTRKKFQKPVVFSGRSSDLVQRILHRQWTLKDLPQRLEPVLNGLW